MTTGLSPVSLTALTLLLATAATAQQPAASIAHPQLWPKVAAQPKRDPAVERRVEALLKSMSVEDKVGQIIQVDIGSITPADVRTYKIGSVLNGGNSGPYGDEYASPAKWLQLADEYYDASMARADKGPKIPIIWGTDSVHGNNNIVGATLFPHNIGLGAARDPDLIREIGRITALETAAAGLDWTFAPTLAVVQDDRWGRTYESYGEEPRIAADYAGAMIEGVQGRVGTKDFLAPDHLIATTKHFLGDGGTGGRDQGDTKVPEEVLRDVHLGGYPAAIEAGTQSVMASFSSWNGEKMSGNASLLTGVLKDRMGFDGFVVGDWNSHGQVPGCSNEDCPQAINAGLDMFMYSGPGWKQLYDNTLREAKDGTIPAARLDDAVRRILRVKVRAGTFDRGRPSARAFAGKFDAIGSPGHRAVARRAVRESLVLLKNEGVLPLKPNANILVAGEAADSISQQAGGWSITWQGIDVPNSAFPNAQSIWKGIEETVKAGGGTARYAPDGRFTQRPDAAILVFGEKPYAEFKGDVPNLEYSPGDKRDLETLRRFKAAGVPVVAVFLSGRPLWVNAELNASDAFVVAFLPGSEGGGVADLLFAGPDGKPRHDFRGKLSFSWPKRPDQYALNRRDAGYDPLFPFGYGLSYARPGKVGKLDESRPAGMAAATPGTFYGRGQTPPGWSIEAEGVTQSGVDRRAQEDSRRFVWKGAGQVAFAAPRAVDLSRESNGEISLVVEYKVDAKPAGKLTAGLQGGGKTVELPITNSIAAARAGEWTRLAVPLQCFAKRGADMRAVTAPLVLRSDGAADISISDVKLDYVSMPMDACGDAVPGGE
ncbi:1,4-beta-D-glucan glucohydrolase [Sphingobium indicum IP26]|uniref:1,4-beta-D-glucan glucohydrolase n=1 Tax=Sphingobium indicum F2 TaxID=1450518 RepID=A0A8E0WQX9_9SPHN|nr:MULTISPECIES: exo 1,3/1,4-beta-D-glucan glucohydrolase [Sphingobium]EPR15053.1 1,4-beta-D-glucan glucohydrolase [Sphingobium indicum IP26]EQB05800.1 1,4-beta-D-glucan glucohydrolase [Sphingobium sp. HDIP04]KER35774.1 1,4-beta-D-glucan glucohydrolase [Sphingobium indicum F2]